MKKKIIKWTRIIIIMFVFILIIELLKLPT